MDMEKISVIFMGKDYAIPADIKDYMHWIDMNPKALLKLLRQLIGIVERNSHNIPEKALDYFEKEPEQIQATMKEIVNDYIQEALKKNVYSISEEALLENSGFEDVVGIRNMAGILFLETAKANLRAKQSGINIARDFAASVIKGSGVGVITNTVSGALLYGLMETNVLKNQAKQADEIYKKAVDELNKRCSDALQANYRDILEKQYYPNMAKKMEQFTNKVYENFLMIMHQNGKFDLDAMSQYSIKKSWAIMGNFDRVSNKEAILEEAFVACPYNVDIFKKMVELGMADENLFPTATVMGFEDIVENEMLTFCRHNLPNIEAISNTVSILAQYKGETEKDVYAILFTSKIDLVKHNMNQLLRILSKSDCGFLIKFISENITPSADEFVNTDRDTIYEQVSIKVEDFFPGKNVETLLSVGVISLEDLRRGVFLGNDCTSIKASMKSKLVERICWYQTQISNVIILKRKEYLEAKQAYESAKSEYMEKTETANIQLSEKEKERNGLNLFAFKRKKEIDFEISDIKKEMERLKYGLSPKLREKEIKMLEAKKDMDRYINLA